MSERLFTAEDVKHYEENPYLFDIIEPSIPSKRSCTVPLFWFTRGDLPFRGKKGERGRQA